VVVIEKSNREIEMHESKDQMLTEKRHRKIKQFIDVSKSLENVMGSHKK
jgi:hypothetical protein